MDCSSALAMLPQPSSNIKYTPLKPLFEFHETISQRFWNAATVYRLDSKVEKILKGSMDSILSPSLWAGSFA